MFHGVSDVDDKKSVNNDERICQVQSGQMDSTPKAAAAPRPIHQLRLEAKCITRKQTISAIVECPLAPSAVPQTRMPAALRSISAYRISPSSPQQFVRTSDDPRPSTTMSPKMKSNGRCYEEQTPRLIHHNSHLPPPNQFLQRPLEGVQVSAEEVQY